MVHLSLELMVCSVGGFGDSGSSGDFTGGFPVILFCLIL